ncbi:hypothetical protein H0A36_20360 [Endozoicomonas sp. SM1973]|uniref:Uncharacterized protein n=1 Tax=Spartinivicinus marinus TaxID=2994442 RepID=A0A853IE94_9GAMM|nr:hypothetical protein [Spartinivicinus marinus]MCX4028176.1 hypothetical protein [Spartinivicinus marinus]NYZ68374.1 hypothetical protein [Spartinivicinus marinus]
MDILSSKDKLFKPNFNFRHIFVLINLIFVNIASLSWSAEPRIQYTLNSAKEQKTKAPINSNPPKKPEITLQLDNSPIDINDPYSIKIENKFDNRFENNLKEPGVKINFTIWFD